MDKLLEILVVPVLFMYGFLCYLYKALIFGKCWDMIIRRTYGWEKPEFWVTVGILYMINLLLLQNPFVPKDEWSAATKQKLMLDVFLTPLLKPTMMLFLCWVVTHFM